MNARSLNPVQQQTLLAIAEGITVTRDIAEEYCISRGTASSRVNRLRKLGLIVAQRIRAGGRGTSCSTYEWRLTLLGRQMVAELEAASWQCGEMRMDGAA